MVTDPDTDEPVPERTYGCLPPEESGLMQCRGSLVPHLNPTNISCCWDSDLCNQDLLPMYNPLPPDSEFENGSGFKNGTTLNHATSMALLVSLTACLVILIIFVAFVYLRWDIFTTRWQLISVHKPVLPDLAICCHFGYFLNIFVTCNNCRCRWTKPQLG